MMTERQPVKIDWESIAAQRAKMEDIASCNLVPRIQELDGMLSMLIHLYNADDNQVMGYTSTSLMKIMLNPIHKLVRDCLKIADEMIGIDADTSPLGEP